MQDGVEDKMCTNDIAQTISQPAWANPFAKNAEILCLTCNIPFFPSMFFSFILFQIEHLYGLTVFENYLYATNSNEGNLNSKTTVIRVNRFNSSDFQVVTRLDRGAALHVYHQRRQPQGAQWLL